MTHDPNFELDPALAEDLKKWSATRWGEPAPNELLTRLTPQLSTLSQVEPASALNGMPEPPAAPVPPETSRVLVSANQRKWRLVLVAGLVLIIGLVGLVLALSVSQSNQQQTGLTAATVAPTVPPSVTNSVQVATLTPRPTAQPTPTTVPTVQPSPTSTPVPFGVLPDSGKLVYPTGQVLKVDDAQGWAYDGLPESKTNVVVTKGALGSTDQPELINQYYHMNLRQAGYEVIDTGGLEIDCFAPINGDTTNCAAAGARTLQARLGDLIISVRIYGAAYRQRLNGSVYAALNAQLGKDQTLIMYTVLQNPAFKSTTPLPTIRVADGLTPVAFTTPTVTPIPIDEAASLKAKPLNLPKLASGAACPVTTGMHYLNPEIAPGIGQEPVYLVGTDNGVIDFSESPGANGWYGQKTLWARSPKYNNAVLIRGGRLDGPGQINFNSVGNDSLLLSSNNGGWVEEPTETYVSARSGCYAFQIDGANFSYTIVFQAR